MIHITLKYYNLLVIVSEWTILEYRKNIEWKILWNKTFGKTTDEMGRQHHKGILVAAEYNRL
jgi:hypothetical protein